jgi:hypothetical protein
MDAHASDEYRIAQSGDYFTLTGSDKYDRRMVRGVVQSQNTPTIMSIERATIRFTHDDGKTAADRPILDDGQPLVIMANISTAPVVIDGAYHLLAA